MPFTKLGDEYRDDPRLQEAGAEGIALDCMARVYCAKHATGGFVSALMLPSLCAAVRRPVKAAESLVAVGWWKPAQDGWWIAAYSEWIPDAKSHAKSSAAGKAGADARWGANRMPSSPSPDDESSSSSLPLLIATWRVLAERKAASETAQGRGPNSPGWYAPVVRGFAAKHAENVAGLDLEMFENPEQLADYLEPKPKPKEHPEDASVRAAYAKLDRVSECPKCDNGWIETEAGEERCAACDPLGENG